MIIVRDPYERLVSAFRDKIERGKPLRKKGVYKRLKALLKRGPSDVPDIQKVHTFPEFLEYVKVELQLGVGNRHWSPMWQLFDPCAFKFDFIAKVETMAQDASFILPHLFRKKFHLFTANKSPNKNHTDVETYYKTVNPKTLKVIRDYFTDDFTAFGYEIDSI